MVRKMLCRVNIGHRWHEEHNDDGEAYDRCSRCGKDQSGRIDGAASVVWVEGAGPVPRAIRQAKPKARP